MYGYDPLHTPLFPFPIFATRYNRNDIYIIYIDALSALTLCLCLWRLDLITCYKTISRREATDTFTLVQFGVKKHIPGNLFVLLFFM